jgi:hypothetical protein
MSGLNNGNVGCCSMGVGKTIIIDAVAGETLRVVFFATGTTSARLKAGESFLTLSKVG